MNNKQIILHFPLTGGGPDQGPNDSGLEHFMGNVPKHIARECAQNSIDAARQSSSPKKKKWGQSTVFSNILFARFTEHSNPTRLPRRQWSAVGPTAPGVFAAGSVWIGSSKRDPFRKLDQANPKSLIFAKSPIFAGLCAMGSFHFIPFRV